MSTDAQETLAVTGIRLPVKVRDQARVAALAERRSLNSEIIVLIERGLRSAETKTATEDGTPIAAD